VIARRIHLRIVRIVWIEFVDQNSQPIALVLVDILAFERKASGRERARRIELTRQLSHVHSNAAGQELAVSIFDNAANSRLDREQDRRILLCFSLGSPDLPRLTELVDEVRDHSSQRRGIDQRVGNLAAEFDPASGRNLGRSDDIFLDQPDDRRDGFAGLFIGHRHVPVEVGAFGFVGLGLVFFLGEVESGGQISAPARRDGLPE